MPWCDDCSKFWAPTAMNVDGSCPTCGRVLDAVERSSPQASGSASDTTSALVDGEDESSRAPWHFWVLVIGVVGYLAWRLVQFILHLV